MSFGQNLLENRSELSRQEPFVLRKFSVRKNDHQVKTPIRRGLSDRLRGVILVLFATSVAPSLLTMCLAFDSHQTSTRRLSLLAAPTCMLLAGVALSIGWATLVRLRRFSDAMIRSVDGNTGSQILVSTAATELDSLSAVLDTLREKARRLTVSEANLKTAVENMVEGIVMISADGRVALHNQRLLKIFGLPPMDATGLPRAEFNAMLVGALEWPQSAQDFLQERLADVRADGSYRVFDVELPNNRVLRYSACLLADGNVMSYIEDISEQHAAAASIQRLAHYDTLTGLPNRALFQQHLATAIGATADAGAAFPYLLLCDLDRFKAVNDSFGHPAGDELLHLATRRMRGQIREGDILARLGGDEFAVIASAHSDNEISRLAQRLVNCLNQPFELFGREVNVGLSIGVAQAPAHGSTAADLMKHADLALYAAKKDGRNRHAFYEPSMSMDVQQHAMLEVALRKALDRGELHLHYQPQVDLVTGRIVGFEALARWQHPERGFIPPDVFIPVAEATGLVVPLGAWALRQACREAMAWNDDVMVAVNVAPQQLRAEGFVASVQECLHEAGLSASRLELEITESAPLHDDEALLSVLKDLAKLGVRVSMDDFGTGNTGLSYLHKFRFDQLKIDKSFIQKLGIWREAEVIVRAIIELSATLGVTTVAEGIESELQASMLKDMRCTMGQGYLFGRPGPASGIREILSHQHDFRANAMHHDGLKVSGQTT